MKTKSAKAKGRRLQSWVREEILEQYNGELGDADVLSTTMGEAGMDIKLSEIARQLFPFAVECKNTEKAKPWEWFDQAQANAIKEKLNAVVVFKKNNKEPLALLDARTFIALTRLAMTYASIIKQAVDGLENIQVLDEYELDEPKKRH